jgi:hypothetical protein
MSARELVSSRIARAGRLSLVIGAAAVAVCVLGAFFAPQQFFVSYLIGYTLWLGVALGSMAILMLYHLVGGMWGFTIRRPLEAAASTIPWVAVFFLPILFGLHHVYSWSLPGALDDPLLRHKHIYLNVPFFIARAAIYFAIWTLLARRLVSLSAEQDRTDDPTLALRLQRMSAPGLIVYALTVTFAGWDWLMSLEPKWWSSIFGMAIIVGQGLSALAVMILVVHRLSEDEPYSEVVNHRVLNDLGNLLLMFVILWAYMAFSQFLIIWAGNLVEEITYYVPRYRTSWAGVGLALVVLYFFAPFFLLLLRATKRRGRNLAAVAAVLFVMRLVHLIWIVEPTFAPSGASIPWMDVLLPVGLGGLWVSAFTARLRALPLLALHDERVEKAVAHGA